MTIYNEIFEFILPLPNRRARIVSSAYGWTLEGMPPSPELAKALHSLIRARVPDGTQVDGMWIWTPVFNRIDKFFKFSYRDSFGNVHSTRVNAGTFSHRTGELL